MSHKINPNDNIQLLEFKLNQDLIALKKVLKWEKAIEKRIEATKLQIQALKSSKQKPMSKIPVPVHPNRKFTPKKNKELASNTAEILNSTEAPEFSNKSTTIINSSPINKSKIHFVQEIKRDVKNSSRESELNNCVDQMNNQQKIIENIQNNFNLIAKVTDQNILGIEKTNNNLKLLTADFERLVNVITHNANAITQMKDAINQMKENENSIISIFDNFKKESFKMFEFIISLCPR